MIGNDESGKVKNLEEALNDYYEHFGENYPLMITGSVPVDEIIDDIEQCIEKNEKAEEPKYEDEADY